MGNAYLQASRGNDRGLLEQALRAYRECLLDDATVPEIRADARHNLELARLLWIKTLPNPDEPPLDVSEEPPTQQPGPKNFNPGKDAAKGSPADGAGTRPAPGKAPKPAPAAANHSAPSRGRSPFYPIKVSWCRFLRRKPRPISRKLPSEFTGNAASIGFMPSPSPTTSRTGKAWNGQGNKGPQQGKVMTKNTLRTARAFPSPGGHRAGRRSELCPVMPARDGGAAGANAPRHR